MTVVFQRKTHLQWYVDNTVLAAGEPGFVSDSQRLKVGDGVTAWRDLPFAWISYLTPGVEEAFQEQFASNLQVCNDAIATKPLYAYTHSYGAIPRVWGIAERYTERLASRIKGGFVVRGVGGAMAHDLAKYIYGSFPLTIQDASSPAGTWNLSPNTFGVVDIDPGRNDAGYDSFEDTVKARAGFSNSVMAMIRLFRAQSQLQDTNAAMVYTGSGWAHTATSPTLYRGGTHSSTAIPGDSVTITTPAGSDHDVVLYGGDPVNAGGFDGTEFTTIIDGVAGPAGSSRNCFAGTKFKVGGSAGSTPFVVGFHGLSNTVHTIKITHAGANDGHKLLTVTNLITQSVNPIQIIIPKIVKLTDAGYAVYGGDASWATDQIYNGLIDNIVAQFAGDKSVISCDGMAFGWDPAIHTWTDGIHPNDAGAKILADAAFYELNKLQPRLGLSTIMTT